MTKQQTNPLSVTLTFGNREFAVRRMTLGQLEKLEAVFTRQDQPSGVTLAKEAVAVALGRDHGSIDVNEIEATPAELKIAMEAVLGVAGFVAKPDAKAA